MLVHRWVATTKPVLAPSVCWAEGSQREASGQLIARNVYWVPLVKNFPAIDSALVVKEKVYVFQMTIAETRGFAATGFRNDFWNIVKDKPIFKGVSLVVVYIYPTGTDFSPSDLNHIDEVGTVEVHEVDMESIDSVTESMNKLLRHIAVGKHPWT